MTTIPTSSESAAELKTDTLGRVRTPPEQRDALLDAREQSGLSGAAFARLHGICYQTFMGWLHGRARGKSSDEPRFQGLIVTSGKLCAHGLSIELPGGGRFLLDPAKQFVSARPPARQVMRARGPLGYVTPDSVHRESSTS